MEVKKHIQRMSNAGCSTPALRLVYVRQQHETSPNVRYLPACTWLHRCSDEIGCCTDDSKTCSASHIESVSLPFFVSPFIHGPFYFLSFFFFSFVHEKRFFFQKDNTQRKKIFGDDTPTLFSLFSFFPFALCCVSGITHMLSVCLPPVYSILKTKFIFFGSFIFVLFMPCASFLIVATDFLPLL